MDSINFILIIRDFVLGFLWHNKKIVQLILKMQLKKKANRPFILRRKGKKNLAGFWISASILLAIQLFCSFRHSANISTTEHHGDWKHTSESYGHQKGSPADHDRKTSAKTAPTR